MASSSIPQDPLDVYEERVPNYVLLNDTVQQASQFVIDNNVELHGDFLSTDTDIVEANGFTVDDEKRSCMKRVQEAVEAVQSVLDQLDGDAGSSHWDPRATFESIPGITVDRDTGYPVGWLCPSPIPSINYKDSRTLRFMFTAPPEWNTPSSFISFIQRHRTQRHRHAPLVLQVHPDAVKQMMKDTFSGIYDQGDRKFPIIDNYLIPTDVRLVQTKHSFPIPLGLRVVTSTVSGTTRSWGSKPGSLSGVPGAVYDACIPSDEMVHDKTLYVAPCTKLNDPIFLEWGHISMDSLLASLPKKSAMSISNIDYIFEAPNDMIAKPSTLIDFIILRYAPFMFSLAKTGKNANKYHEKFDETWYKAGKVQISKLAITEVLTDIKKAQSHADVVMQLFDDTPDGKSHRGDTAKQTIELHLVPLSGNGWDDVSSLYSDPVTADGLERLPLFFPQARLDFFAEIDIRGMPLIYTQN